MNALIELIALCAWIVGLIWLFKERHWAWGVVGLFVPIIPIAYLVYRYLPRPRG